jgi:pimeloyl-ACP methyl ester carboxylesterase
MPGLSGFAIPFVEWFFDLHNSNTCIVSFDYRGFGLSEYDDSKNIVYDGININTISVDLYNLYSLLKLQNKNLFILGHSFGNLVAYNFLNNFNISNLYGFIQIEESLMNVSQINATDTTYPKISSFSWNNVEKWVSQYQTYSPTNGYNLVNSTLLEQFVIPGFAKTKRELNTWMKYTTNINGNILGFLFKDAMMVDYTYMVNAIFVKKNIPMFIYSGAGSIVPSDTQIWIYNKVSNNKLSKLLLISERNGGYHVPFLPTSIAKKTLFQNIHKYIKNINDSFLNIDNTLYSYQTKMLQKRGKGEKKHKTKKMSKIKKGHQTKIMGRKRK